MLRKPLKQVKKLKFEGLEAGWVAGWLAGQLAIQPASQPTSQQTFIFPVFTMVLLSFFILVFQFSSMFFNDFDKKLTKPLWKLKN